jgi:hypothetical protein
MKDSKNILIKKCITNHSVIAEIGVAKNKVDSLADYISAHPEMTNDDIIERLAGISYDLKQRSMNTKCKKIMNESALADLYKDSASFKCKGFAISDHAIVRYLQRAMGVDMKELVSTIIGEIDLSHKPTGVGVYRVNNTVKDVKYLIDGKVVITVIEGY